MGNQLRECTKPIMNVERFMVNQNVAGCGDPIYTPISVSCNIKSGDVEGVFYSGTGTKCTYYATSSNLITLNGVTYLYWYGSSSGNPETGYTDSDTGIMYGSVLMNALKAEGLNQNTTSGVLHAGVASAEVLSYINSSY